MIIFHYMYLQQEVLINLESELVLQTWMMKF